MAVSQEKIRRCRKKLEELAKQGERLTYGALMGHLSMGRHEIASCLNPIYEEEMRTGRPDLTLIPHYSGSRFGLYSSRGDKPQTTKVSARNFSQVHAYKDDLRKVYEYWGGQSRGALKKWLES